MRTCKSSCKNIILIQSLFLLLLATQLLHADTGWKLEKNEEAIKVYLRDTPNSAIKSFKGTTTIKTSLSAIVSVLNDSANYPRWLFNARNANTLSRISDTEIHHYVVTDMPWPVVDRDAVIIAKRTQNSVNKQVTIALTTQATLVPNVEGKVRIEHLVGRWLLTPINSQEISVVYEMSIDPGGNIPTWVVNAMTVDLPFYTLKNLKTISKEAQYVNAKVSGLIN